MSDNPNLTIAEARAAERERIAAILSDPVAQDRRHAAEALAFGSSMEAAEAVTLLATLDGGPPGAQSTDQRSEAEALGQLIGEAGLAMPSPHRTAGKSDAKSLWKSAIAGVNREQAAAAPAVK